MQFTVVVPIGNVLADGGLHKTAGLGSHESVAVTPNVTTAPLAFVHSAVMSELHWIVGGIVSWTVTRNEQLEECPK